MAIETLDVVCPHCLRGLRVIWPNTLTKRRPPRRNPLSRWIRRRAVTAFHHYDAWQLGKAIRDALLVHSLTTCPADPLGLDDLQEAQ